MDVDEARSRLAVGIDAIECLVVGVGDEEAAYRPNPDAWSVLDVLGHVLYEESVGFRARLRACLQDPDGPWPPFERYDPVEATHHGARSVRALVERFREERAVSFAWLGTLEAPDLDRACGEGGRRRRAGDLLATWVANDLVQLRRLTGARLAWWARRAAPFDVGAAAGRDGQGSAVAEDPRFGSSV